MPRPFDTFIVIAAMRTGSNFLEASLNRVPNLACHGEAFNPHFVCFPNKDQMFGMDLAAREADPLELVARIRRSRG